MDKIFCYSNFKYLDYIKYNGMNMYFLFAQNCESPRKGYEHHLLIAYSTSKNKVIGYVLGYD